MLLRLKYLAFLIIAGFLVAGTGIFAETVNYTYDDMNRLIKVKYGDGTVVEYEYDKAGNRTKQKTTVSDTTPPTVTATSPSNGATGVAVDATISATFSEAVDSSTLNTSTFTLRGGVTGTVSYNSDTNTATFKPASNLNYATTYTATITTGVKDIGGNSISSNYTWSFTTIKKPDTSAPVGSVSINEGAAYTTVTGVTLTLSATDDAGVAGYYVSESSSTPSASASGWTGVTSAASYNGSVSYILSSGDGTKTVYVWYKDDAPNVSSAASDTIVLDANSPTVTITSPTSDSAYTATSGTINLGGSASDSTSGISSVTWSSDKGSSGTASGTTSWTVSGISLSSGNNVITVMAKDGAEKTATDALTVTYSTPITTPTPLRPSPSPTPTPVASPTPTVKPTQSPTPSPKPTSTPAPTAVPTQTQRPTPTASPSPLPSPTPSPMTSPTPTDGTINNWTWTNRTSGTTNALNGVTYGNGQFIAVGNNGTIITSPDGITWTTRTSGTSNGLLGIVYGNGQFIAVGNSSTILTSPDGVNWTTRSSGTSIPILSAITFGDGHYVVTGWKSWGDNTILTSTDGINWTGKMVGAWATTIDGVTYGNGLFVAVGGGWNAGRIWTSADSVNWTERTSLGSWADHLLGITYGNGLFVTVGSWNGNALATSTDGINWTRRTTGSSKTLHGVTYGSGYFIIVGNSGTILSSPDGINWTTRTSGTSNGLGDVTYGDRQFIAVGNSGTILTLTTSSGDTSPTPTPSPAPSPSPTSKATPSPTPAASPSPSPSPSPTPIVIGNRTIETSVFKIAWDSTCPDMITSIIYKPFSKTQNITNITWSGSLGEFSGEGRPFVTKDSRGSWTAYLVKGSAKQTVKVITESKNGTKVPIKTEYLIEEGGQQIKMAREFYFSQISGNSSNWEPHVIRAYPRNKFTSYMYPSTSGKSITGSPEESGKLHSDWDGTWAVVEAPSTQLHILLKIDKKTNLSLSGLWTDKDAWSSTSWIYPAISSPTGGAYTTDSSVSITYDFQVGSLVIPTPTPTSSPTSSPIPSPTSKETPSPVVSPTPSPMVYIIANTNTIRCY